MVVATRTDSRERILDATERLLARYGYRKMTMDDIAQEAGVGRRTIYLHFPSKEEVALCSIDRVAARLLERLRIALNAPLPPDERLHAMLLERVLFRFESVQNYYSSFDEMFAALRPAYLARREGYFDAEAQLFALALRSGVETGAFALRREGEQSAESAAQEMAKTLLYATNALLPYSLSREELGSRERILERITRLADLLLNGLRCSA